MGHYIWPIFEILPKNSHFDISKYMMFSKICTISCHTQRMKAKVSPMRNFKLVSESEKLVVSMMSYMIPFKLITN